MIAGPGAQSRGPAPWRLPCWISSGGCGRGAAQGSSQQTVQHCHITPTAGHVVAGYYWDAANAVALECGVNSYADQARAKALAASCTPCGAGTNTNGAVGGTSSAACGE